MKRFILSAWIALFPFIVFAQYNVGTSTTGETDIFGNTTTTHKDRYGNTTGTSTTKETDIFGNTTTEQKSNNPNAEIWSWE